MKQRLATESKPCAEPEEISGAEAIMRTLVARGVDTIFGYPGGAIMPAYDALYHYRDRIRHILVRHEQGASHAAEGHARVTGRAGVCIATSGPGATNLVTGIADAMMDSIPLVCITGQVGRHFLGTDAFQEADVIGITMPITKWNYQVTSADEIPEILTRAFEIAEEGRPGPVVVDITKNAQVEKFMYTPPSRAASANRAKLAPVLSKDAFEAAGRLIDAAERPLMLVGHGILISRAQAELLKFAETTGIPVASTLLGLSAFPNGHEQYVGMLGMHGNYGPNLLTNEADLIVAIGMRFDDRVTGNLAKYALKAKVIHVDIDPAEINKNVKADVGIVADAKVALRALQNFVARRRYPEWVARFKECDAKEYETVIRHELYPTEGMLKMSEVVNHVSEKTGGEAIVVTDVGQHQMVAARYYRFTKTDGLITSGGLGTMGFGVPAAMGAACAAGTRPVIAIVGDGGFQMTCQELGAIAQEGLPVKTIILNNNFLGMVRQWQELFFERRYSQVEMMNADFVKLSEAFGVPAERVDSREQLDGAIQRMLATEGPYLLDVRVEREGNVFPMVPAGAGVSEVRLA